MSKQTGDQAESAAARYLEFCDYTIICRNWRSRYCEIDIIAQSQDGIAFVEVKYRSRTGGGDGFDYITRDKLRRMRRAAQAYVLENNMDASQQLLAVSVSGDLFQDVRVIDLADATDGIAQANL